MLIYQIRNRVNNKVYIGMTRFNDAQRRWREHIMSAQKGSQLILHRAIRKYGQQNFSVTILRYARTLKEMAILEARLIKRRRSTDRRSGYNYTRGGTGFTGPHSKETRRKFKGRIPWNKGKVGFRHSRQACLNMSRSHLGHHISKQTREKIRQALMGNTNPSGIVRSKGFCEAISERLMGNKYGRANRKPGKRYPSGKLRPH